MVALPVRWATLRWGWAGLSWAGLYRPFRVALWSFSDFSY
jgi:hypothetical protein